MRVKFSLYPHQVEVDGRGAVNLGFEDEGDAVKWRKHGGEDRRRSSSRRDASNGGGGCIYEGTSVDDNDVFGEKLREDSVVVIQVKKSSIFSDRGCFNFSSLD